jgi:uncharacterized protein (UPF0261 family)
MPAARRVLVIGTADTKADELLFLKRCIESDGALALMMDVGVVGEVPFAVDVSRHDVAHAAGATIAGVIALGDEHQAMTKMAEGAALIAAKLHAQGQIHAMLALGGSMGTDLALDVAAALPLGVPKIVISTIAFSPMIPADRVAPDLMMILWAGGLYGLNGICKSVLSQAAGAAAGAARAAVVPDRARPLVGVTSFGKSCLTYMVRLVPELDARGYDVAVFHASGLGGRAFEALAAQGRFAAVLDFAVQEVTNHHFGSAITAGPNRLTSAGRAGVPQLVAPGAMDMIDVPGWGDLPAALRGRELRPHNRLISSAITTKDERAEVARVIATRLNGARGPTKLLVPLKGFHEWDREGGPLRDAQALQACIETFRKEVRPPVELLEIDTHINDDTFVDVALGCFDLWVREGVVAKPMPAFAGVTS